MNPNYHQHYSPALAAGLSLIPGLGHLYLGEKGKGATLLIIDAGISCAIFFSKGSILGLLLLPLYFFIMIPAALESYQRAKGETSWVSQSRAYVVVLLLIKGFFALPLLWQSPLFSKKSKWMWTVAVPVLAELYFIFLFFYGRTLFELVGPLLHQKKI